MSDKKVYAEYYHHITCMIQSSKGTFEEEGDYLNQVDISYCVPKVSPDFELIEELETIRYFYGMVVSTDDMHKIIQEKQVKLEFEPNFEEKASRAYAFFLSHPYFGYQRVVALTNYDRERVFETLEDLKENSRKLFATINEYYQQISLNGNENLSR